MWYLYLHAATESEGGGISSNTSGLVNVGAIAIGIVIAAFVILVLCITLTVTLVIVFICIAMRRCVHMHTLLIRRVLYIILHCIVPYMEKPFDSLLLENTTFSCYMHGLQLTSCIMLEKMWAETVTIGWCMCIV